MRWHQMTFPLEGDISIPYGGETYEPKIEAGGEIKVLHTAWAGHKATRQNNQDE